MYSYISIADFISTVQTSKWFQSQISPFPISLTIEVASVSHMESFGEHWQIRILLLRLFRLSSRPVLSNLANYLKWQMLLGIIKVAIDSGGQRQPSLVETLYPWRHIDLYLLALGMCAYTFLMHFFFQCKFCVLFKTCFHEWFFTFIH